MLALGASTSTGSKQKLAPTRRTPTLISCTFASFHFATNTPVTRGRTIQSSLRQSHPRCLFATDENAFLVDVTILGARALQRRSASGSRLSSSKMGSEIRGASASTPRRGSGPLRRLPPVSLQLSARGFNIFFKEKLPIPVFRRGFHRFPWPSKVFWLVDQRVNGPHFQARFPIRGAAGASV